MKSIGLIFLLMFTLNISATTEAQNASPKLNNGAKWRIGYYEGGEYAEYQMTLIAMIKGLMKLGWIEPADIPPQPDIQTGQLWNWLAEESESKYLQFVKDAYYNIRWDKKRRKETTDRIIERLNRVKDIDLMLAMGTWAGQELANDRHKTPVIVLSSSDAVAAGIVKTTQDSGYDHVHAFVDPFHYERQIRVFHKVIGFKKLGIAYLDTVEGRSYAALDVVKKIAEKYGFEIVHCHVKYDTDLEIEEESIRECFKELAQKADAIYVTAYTGINTNTIPELVNIFNTYRIPTFSQMGMGEVEQGFLMTIAPKDYQYAGDFYAETAAKIFNGATPRQLPMFFKQPYKWEFNFETAQKIGLSLSSLNLEDDYLFNPDF